MGVRKAATESVTGTRLDCGLVGYDGSGQHTARFGRSLFDRWRKEHCRVSRPTSVLASARDSNIGKMAVPLLYARRIVPDVLRLREANRAEAPALEALQRRASDVWEAYRQQLAANPDAIELPATFIDNGWVRVAVDDTDRPIGFSVVVPTDGQVHELDGLFVEPEHMLGGVGRALVEDAAARASRQGAQCLEVTAGPARKRSTNASGFI